MILVGDYVRILRGNYKEEIGIVKGFVSSRYKIKLLNKSLEVRIPEHELEKISKEKIKESIIKIRFDDGTEEILKDKDLHYKCKCLNNNRFRGLYALGKYYPKKVYPEKHNRDYFTQQILKIKNFNKNSAQEIAHIYASFINQSELLKDIINKIKYICFMPSINYRNHVGLWGSYLCESFGIQEISDIITIPPDKEEDLKYYKYKSFQERQKIISGAYIIHENNINFKEKNCLILDDICTTGLQINELSFILSKAGIEEIYAFVIGRTKY